MGVDMMMPTIQTRRQRLESQRLAKILDAKELVNLDLAVFVEFDAVLREHVLAIQQGGA